jgi:hypothetical protein
MADLDDNEKEAEAVYYQALTLLDGLRDHAARRNVVLNWVKYICLSRASEITPPERDSLLPAFCLLTADFACHVTELPDRYPRDLDRDRCGKCPTCVAAGIQPPEAKEAIN